jgi:hypothetical protein
MQVERRYIEHDLASIMHRWLAHLKTTCTLACQPPSKHHTKSFDVTVLKTLNKTLEPTQLVHIHCDQAYTCGCTVLHNIGTNIPKQNQCSIQHEKHAAA